ncbi:BatD family protein [Marinobacterium nitratireducens]|uniref:BatD family protein n=1 Tax=Marinobacterium nitratireducens TaxID=518897 RepID=UPI00166F5BFC|nr:BatD family protein [Marinobacterium nitratireducens]
MTASLDRRTITVQDRVRLTLETDERAPQSLDFSPLYQDFQFLGSRQLRLSSHASGDSRYRTRWEILLRPKSPGDIEVPRLQVGTQSSRPLSLHVLPSEASNSGTEGEPLFIEAELDRREAYVDSQLIYSVRLYHAQELAPGSQLSPPHLNGGLIKPLGEQQRYNRQVSGRQYEVIEQRFAIFPSKSGEQSLEGPIFEGRSALDGRRLELQAPAREISIAEPAYRSARGYWLPARAVTLEDSDIPEAVIEPNQPLAYSITLTATGLPAVRLPDLAPPGTAALDVQVDSIELDEEVGDQGLVSRRTEHLSLIPRSTGTLELPPVDLTWWDLSAGQARNVSLPGRQLLVRSAGSEPPRQAFSGLGFEQASLGPGLQQALDKSRLLIALLTLTSLVSSLGWLYTFNHLRLLRRESRRQAQEEELRRHRKLLMAHQMAEKNTFQALAMACQQNNPEVAKLRLIEWAQNFWPDQQIFSGEDISDAARSQALDFLILDLEQHLYLEDDMWHGDLLLEAIGKLRARRPEGYEDRPAVELPFAS